MKEFKNKVYACFKYCDNIKQAIEHVTNVQVLKIKRRNTIRKIMLYHRI